MHRRLLLLPTLLLAVAQLGCDPKNGDEADDLLVTYSDEDGDTIIDHMEGLETDDFDGDGIPNYLDLDSDGDTIDDMVEAGDVDALTLPVDSDGDTSYDFLDLDSDDNCIPDRQEKGGPTPRDLDEDGREDYNDPDNDGDGITDAIEIGPLCAVLDSDDDGTPDFEDADSDGDGVGDKWEAGTSAWSEEPADTDGDGTPDYLDDDSDGDGFSDSEEGGVDGPAQEPVDTDGDGTYDFADTDSDNDGLSDSQEAELLGTDPYDDDSDGDGFSDGAEVEFGSDPNDAFDQIEVGVYVEVPERDTTEQFFSFDLAIEMGDIVFLLDTTGSMGGVITSMSSEFGAIVSTLSTTIPDAQYGFATYNDYFYSNYGSSGDLPFVLEQQITSDTTLVQSSISSASPHGGNDGPESGMEALYQALTGAGYDQNCDGSYQANTDVLPLIANSSDPFYGAGGESYNAASAGGGDRGGMGFRDGALPVIVYATDNYLRDSGAGYGTPGGCHIDASGADVVGAANDVGAFLIGVGTNGTPITQMNNLADATGSFADTNGDGVANERLVFQYSSSSSSGFRSTITEAIEDLVSSVHFDEISLEIEGDDWGFITDIQPSTVDLDGAVNGETLTFTLSFLGTVAASDQDQYYNLTLNILGNGTTLLDSQDIVIVVPATSY